MQYVAEAWTLIKEAEPPWVSAGASLVAAIFASVFVVRWYLLRRDLRGSGAAIIAFLGDHKEPRVLKGTSKSVHSSNITTWPSTSRPVMSTIICARVISNGSTGWDTFTGRSINTAYRALDACC